METLKSRTGQPTGYPERLEVPEEAVDWSVDFPEYNPPYYVDPTVIANDRDKKLGGWADPEDHRKVDFSKRPSAEGKLIFTMFAKPLNPKGRTGLRGRGLLGKWGPNYAADPIITRVNTSTNKLEVLVIVRRDNGEVALPGGMVDYAEAAINASQREAVEEALGGRSFSMAGATLVYKGYVDDPRNTDNAWIETSAFHKHLSEEEGASLAIEAGDDAVGVFWMEVNAENMSKLYASHAGLVRMAVCQMSGASADIVLALRGFIAKAVCS